VSQSSLDAEQSHAAIARGAQRSHGRTLHRRLLAPYLITLVVTLILAWWTATYLLTRSLEQRLADQLQHATDVLTRGDLPLSDELLRRLAQLLDVDVLLVNESLEVVATTRPGGPESLPSALDLDWDLTAAAAIPQRLSGGDESYLAVTSPVKATHDPRYAGLALAAGLGDIRAAAHRAALWLGAGAVVAALFIAWFGHRAALTITGPIRRLVQAANQVAAGRRDVQVTIDEPGEIGELAESFNSMVQRLAEFEEDALRRNRYAAIGEMAARVAHEVRNPLTAIKMQLQLLSEPGNTGQIEPLVDEIRRLELIVNTLLQQGQPPILHPAAIDLNRVIKEVAQLFQPHLAHQGLVLQLALHPDLPRTWADADRIKQILVNLLVNARDALSEGDTILIRSDITDAGNMAQFEVADSGPGIPEDKRSVLFLAGHRSEKPQGLGLGLRLVHELTEAHGGIVDLGESTLGGASFRIRLPLAPAS
jgi:signal transduction histidine kinase